MVAENLRQLLSQGGPALVAIVAVSTVGWALAAWKWASLQNESGQGQLEVILDNARRGRRDRALAAVQGAGLADRLLREALRAREPSRRFFDQHMRPILHGEAQRLRDHLPLLRALTLSLPLLGLLGTVLGMVQTFDALMRHGAGSVSELADGISQALITTQAGLVFALPLLLAHGLLSARARRLIDNATLRVKKLETALLGD